MTGLRRHERIAGERDSSDEDAARLSSPRHRWRAIAAGGVWPALDGSGDRADPMSMHAFSPSIRLRALDASELTMAERVALALAIGGRRVQDLVVTLGISRNEAKRLMKVRDQLGRSCSPCMLAMLATAE